MTTDELVTVISNLGFPIACVIGMGLFIVWYIKKVETDHDTREKELQQTITTNTEAINAMKEMITTFMDYFAKMNNSGKE